MASRPKISVDTSSGSLSQEDLRALRLYGRLPSQSKAPKHFARQVMKERKYFDSGDYALSKAAGEGKISILDTPGAIASQHPLPSAIPHPSSGLSRKMSMSSTVSSTSGGKLVGFGGAEPPSPLRE